MSLSTCIKCGGHIPLGPNASNHCEDCGAFVFGEPKSDECPRCGVKNGKHSHDAECEEISSANSATAPTQPKRKIVDVHLEDA